MSFHPKTTQARNAVLAATFSLAATYALLALVHWAWPRPLLVLPGLQVWSVASYAVGVSLAFLASVPDRGPPQTGGLVYLLAYGALVAVFLGSVTPGVVSLLDQLEHVPPMAELPRLLTELQGYYGPLVLVLAALPASMVIRLLTAESIQTRAPALLGLGWLSLLGLGLTWRAHDWAGQSSPLWTGRSVDALELGTPHLGWMVPCTLLALAGSVLLLRQRQHLAAGAWITVLLVMADPVPLVSKALFELPEPGDPLPSTVDRGAGSSLPLLDLTSSPPRYGGSPWLRDLPVELAAASFWDQGPDFLLSERLPRPWDYRKQRAIHMAVPLTARCGELVSTIAVLRRYGVSLWLWPGESGVRAQGPLAAAFEHPVIEVLTYPPLATAEVDPCGTLLLEPGQLRVLGDSTPALAIPARLDQVPRLFSGCEGSVLVAPTPDTELSTLFAVLDRLAGTHPGARFQRRVATSWPGLDIEPTDGDRKER